MAAGRPGGWQPALLAWFVLHPPRGVDVVSFFITSRYTGRPTATPSPRRCSSSWPSSSGEQPHEVTRTVTPVTR